MSGFAKYNAAGTADDTQPPFSDEELEAALSLRQRTRPDRRASRRTDRCPHTPMCDKLDDCVEAIAWYLRHRRVIEARQLRERQTA